MKSPFITLTSTLAEMIPAMRAACTLPPLSPSELNSVCNAWTLVLEKTVPANRVKEMFTLLLQTPRDASDKRSRVIGAPDIRDLWFKIHAEEQDRVRVIANKGCKACNGSKSILIWSPEQHANISVACPFHSGGSDVSRY
jgi:hypothetical protein